MSFRFKILSKKTLKYLTTLLIVINPEVDAILNSADSFLKVLGNNRLLVFIQFMETLFRSIQFSIQARLLREGHKGHCPSDFYFCPPPPDLFLALPLYFFLKVSIALTVKIVVILTVPYPILTSILFD